MSWKKKKITCKNMNECRSIFIDRGIFNKIEFKIFPCVNEEEIRTFYIKDEYKLNSDLLDRHYGLPLSDKKYEIFLLKDDGYYYEEEDISNCKKINISGYNLTILTRLDNYKVIKSIHFKNREELNKIEMYMNDQDNQNYYYPNIYDIKVGDKLYLIGEGICTLTNINEKEDDYVLKVALDKSNENREVKFSDNKICLAPYEHKKCEIFDEHINERNFGAKFTRITNEKVNLYWQRLENAACYKIKIYRYVCQDTPILREELYFLKEIEIPHYECLAVIKDIYNYGMVLVLSAEDREGNVIAKTRGIKIK